MTDRKIMPSFGLLGGCALSALAFAALAAPAMAQEDAAAAPQLEKSQIQDIVVTARRRDETLQSTPIAITAIAAAQIENKGAVTIGDLQGSAPNLLITQQNSGAAAANLSIRGLTYADIEKSQEPTVGVVVDGVFIGTSTGQFFDFFDIKQIEVLRGPQGTLFGRNTIGGVISIQRSRPTGEFGAKLEGTYGSYNTWAAKSIINLPIVADKLAAKAWYIHNESDGFYRHGITGKRAGGSNSDNFGASFLFTPSSNFDALLTVEKQIQKFDVVNPTIARTGELFCNFMPANQCNRNTSGDLYTVFNDPGTSNYRAPSVTYEMNLDLDAVKLTSITGYRKSTERQTQDFDSSTADLYYVLRLQNYRQWSQELRAGGKVGDNFDYVVGGYFFDSKYNLTQFTRLFGFNPTLDPRVADPAPQNVTGKNRSYAVFGDFIWAFADQFRLSFGGRYTWDKKELTNAFGVTPVGSGAADFKKFTPKIGLDYRPDANTLLYASWSRGYRSGGFSPRAATADTASLPYQPETVDSYEIGAKLDLFDRMLQFNVAAFYAKYKNLQQNTTIPGGPTGNQTITSNVGSELIKGVEIDFVARPATALRISGSAGFLDTKFKNFVAGNVLTFPAPVGTVIRPFDYSGNDPIYSPKFNASFNIDYTLDTSFGDVVANVGYRYIGRYDQQISLGPLTGNTGAVSNGGTVIVNGNDPRVRSDAQGLVDASLTAHFDMGKTKAKFTVFGRNLANDRGPSAAFTVAGLWSFASAREPRTFGATLGVEF
ncbi:TonB-dependent receptor [Sphingobium sp. CR2-8]|uniref:TonB-dependent receptor n=1 Tax=Sphingobium sp. CR2-8 TaxID=1306534 RepID=UPI002DBC4216|nr:TonB-dependent receptor [Sphingobium sp. CR2-8]MEC3910995.1 TonB-dependent receptor [Sphingobium sp. CR2-8]